MDLDRISRRWENGEDLQLYYREGDLTMRNLSKPAHLSASATFLVVVLASAVLAGSARGGPIVETFESFADQTVLTTQISGLTISADSGTPTVTVATSPVVPGEPKGLAHIPYFDFPDILLITFNPGTSIVGAIVDFGMVGTGVMLTAFDGPDGTGNILGMDSTTTESFISVSAAGIRSAQFENLGGATYLIDNLTYELFAPSAPPDCSAAIANPTEIWPPNHKFEDVSVVGVTDPDGDPVAITITDIAQDEPLEGLGGGNTCPDADGVGTDIAYVRAERSGTKKTSGDGRVYHLSFTADDGQGGECSATVTVCVPHDQRQGHVCVDQGPLFDSTVCGE